MIDIDKYKGHTEAPWLELEVDKVVAYQFDENDNPKMICNVFRDGDGGSAYEGGWGDNEVEANQKLIADAPLLLAEVKRLRERLMLAESALGEVRACHEDGQGNLGEILEHYRDKEGVEMPNAFDEVIE